MPSIWSIRFLCVVCCLVIVLVVVCLMPPASDVLLEIGLENGAIEYLDGPTVEIRNDSAAPIRFWHPDSTAGRHQLTFVMRNLSTGKQSFLQRKSSFETGRDPSRNNSKSSTIVLQPGQSFEFQPTFCKTDKYGTRWHGLPLPNTGARFVVSARFSAVLLDDDKCEAGRIEVFSPAVITKLTHSLLHTPLDYIRYGFEKRVIDLLQQNPEWIGQKGRAYSPTLHVASRSNQLLVAEWLLDNGADVHALDRGGATALHLANSAEMATLLLDHGAYLTARRSRDHPIDGPTALDIAVHKMKKASSRPEKRRWEKVVDVYQRAGGRLDLENAIALGDIEDVEYALDQNPEFAEAYPKPGKRTGNPLIEATRNGHCDICQMLIEDYLVDLNEMPWGYPAVNFAIDHPSILRLFVEQGAEIHHRIYYQKCRLEPADARSEGATLLHIAASRGQCESLQILLDAGIDPFVVDRVLFAQGRYGRTALEVAAENLDWQTVATIIDHPSFESGSEDRQQEQLNKALLSASLAWASSEHGDGEEFFRELIWRGADANSVDYRGWTAIQNVAFGLLWSGQSKLKDRRRLVALLDSLGGSIDPFSAIALNHEKMVTGFLRDDPSVANVCTPAGFPSLNFAAALDYRGIARQLILSGADVNSLDENQMAPLHRACRSGNLEMARMLCVGGANLNIADNRGLTPLHYAVEATNRPDLVRLLLEHGADANASTTKGKTSLHLATNSENTVVIKLLLRSGANPQARDSKGQTPFCNHKKEEWSCPKIRQVYY